MCRAAAPRQRRSGPSGNSRRCSPHVAGLSPRSHACLRTERLAGTGNSQIRRSRSAAVRVSMTCSTPRPGSVLRVHAPAGVVPPQPSEHLQHRRVPGDESAGSSLQARDRAGLRRLGRSLIVPELHAGIVIGFETLRHADSVSRLDDQCHDGLLRRAPPPRRGRGRSRANRGQWWTLAHAASCRAACWGACGSGARLETRSHSEATVSQGDSPT
jgi:hypothetical protein